MLAARRPLSPEVRRRTAATAPSSPSAASATSSHSAAAKPPARVQRVTAVVGSVRREAVATRLEKSDRRRPLTTRAGNAATGPTLHRQQLQRERDYDAWRDLRQARLAHRPFGRRATAAATPAAASRGAAAARRVVATVETRRAPADLRRADVAVDRAAQRLRQAKAKQKAEAKARQEAEAAAREKAMRAQMDKAGEAERRAAAVRKMRAEAEAAEREKLAKGQTRWGGAVVQPVQPGRTFRPEDEKKRLQRVVQEQRRQRKVRGGGGGGGGRQGRRQGNECCRSLTLHRLVSGEARRGRNASEAAGGYARGEARHCLGTYGRRPHCSPALSFSHKRALTSPPRSGSLSLNRSGDGWRAPPAPRRRIRLLAASPCPCCRTLPRAATRPTASRQPLSWPRQRRAPLRSQDAPALPCHEQHGRHLQKAMTTSATSARRTRPAPTTTATATVRYGIGPRGATTHVCGP